MTVEVVKDSEMTEWVKVVVSLPCTFYPGGPEWVAIRFKGAEITVASRQAGEILRGLLGMP